jgi:rare lipoprotein A
MILRTVQMVGCAVAISIALASCAKKSIETGQVQVGVASWYGHPFDGRPTASGEIYDMKK